MAIKFEPPQYWELDAIRQQFEAFTAPDQQLYFLRQVEDAIADIENDILIAQYDSPDGSDMLYYQDIPDILSFCSRKRGLIEQEARLLKQHFADLETTVPTPEELLILKGNRIDWTGSHEDLDFLFDSLADAGMIPKEQCDKTTALQHFWIVDEEPDVQLAKYAGLTNEPSPLVWLGQVKRIAELLWELNGKFVRFEWYESKLVLEHFRLREGSAQSRINHGSFKAYVSGMRTGDRDNSRLRNPHICDIVDALVRRMGSELRR